MKMRTRIDKIGQELVACKLYCEGITNHPSTGILPRCLFVDEGAEPEGKGCVVVGLNPGVSKEFERQSYLSNGCTYSNTVDYWNKHVKDKNKFYKRLYGFLSELGYCGPVIWTELVKCERAPQSRGVLPLQTCRTCSHKFLKRELAEVDQEWPIFAIGREAFKGVSYMVGDRAVVGVPHPTGSRGQFSGLFIKDTKRLRKPVTRAAKEAVKTKLGLASWLTANGARAY